MAEPGKRCVTSARQAVGLLLLLAFASYASDATVDDLTLQGTVVDAGTGLPVAGADVRHLSLEARYSSTGEDDPPPGWSATTDDEGHFTLVDLPSRDVYLQVTAEGYARSRGIRVSPDTNRLDIRLGNGATIEGTLSLVRGGPAMGEVTLSLAGRPWESESLQVDPFGRFRFEHVTPGSYRLSARSSSGVAESREVRVAEGERVAVDFSLVQLGRVTGWISGLLAGESASIALYQDDESQRYVRGSAEEFGNGLFELHGIEDGAYVVKARAGRRSLSTRAEVISGDATVAFAFVGRSRLTGRVLAGTRPIPQMSLSIAPVNDAMPSAYAFTDELGQFEFGGLDDGEYDIDVQLGPRGTSRSFPVTVFGETVSDLRLGPYSISGTTAPEFRNSIVQARFLVAGDEPVVHRAIVRNGQFRFDGLEQGNYQVTHMSPYYDHVVEVQIFGASVEGVALATNYSETITVQVVDAESGQQLPSLTCAIEEGPWAGVNFGSCPSGTTRCSSPLDDRPTLRIPVSLTNTRMTCTSRGYDGARFRWDRRPLLVELARTSAAKH